MSDSTFKGWTRPGPLLPARDSASIPSVEDGETLDYLCGHYRIFQLEKGHRFSVDDLMTAWFGTSFCPSAGRIADLGSGIGSAGIIASWRCPGAVVHTVEAEAASLRLACKSIQYNGLQDRYFAHLGDLRDPHLFAGESPFDLVLGSPPYWPEGARVPALHPQAVSARLETRGHVGDYAIAAARLLAPGGVYACVFPNDQIARATAAYKDAGLIVLHRREVIFKEGEPYGISLFAGSRKADLPPIFSTHPGLPMVDPPLLVRRKDGSVDPSIALVRLVVGFSPGLLP